MSCSHMLYIIIISTLSIVFSQHCMNKSIRETTWFIHTIVPWVQSLKLHIILYWLQTNESIRKTTCSIRVLFIKKAQQQLPQKKTDKLNSAILEKSKGRVQKSRNRTRIALVCAGARLWDADGIQTARKQNWRSSSAKKDKKSSCWPREAVR